MNISARRETGVDIGNVAALQLPAQSNATWSILTTGTAFNYSVASGLVTVTAGQIVETTDGSLYRYTGSTPLTNFDLGAQTSPGLRRQQPVGADQRHGGRHL